MPLIAVNFHYIREDFSAPFPSIFGITPDDFQKRLMLYKNYGDFISQEDLLKCIDQQIPLDGNYFHVTFDDGLAEQYENALPILDALNIPATFFVNTSHFKTGKLENVHKVHIMRSRVSSEMILELNADYFLKDNGANVVDAAIQGIRQYKYDDAKDATLKWILNFQLNEAELNVVLEHVEAEHADQIGETKASDYYMNAEQISALANRNYLGSHGHEHIPIGMRPLEKQIETIAESSRVIEALSGKKMRLFSYPYGSAESVQDVHEVLRSHGYAAAFTMERARNEHITDPYYLARLDNNDMPGGKAWKFGTDSPFDHYQPRTWFTA